MNKIFKILLFFCCTLLSSISLISQEWRIQAGTTFSRMTNWENDYKSDFRTGFKVGAMFEKNMLYFSSFETGIELVSKGMKSDSIRHYSLDYQLLYFDIPFLLKLKAGISEKVIVYGKGGFYTGFGLSGKQIWKDKINNYTYDETVSWGENKLNRIDYGLMFGGGIEYGKYQLNISYQYGFIAAPIDYSFSDQKFYNRTFKISLGYILK